MEELREIVIDFKFSPIKFKTKLNLNCTVHLYKSILSEILGSIEENLSKASKIYSSSTFNIGINKNFVTIDLNEILEPCLKIYDSRINEKKVEYELKRQESNGVSNIKYISIFNYFNGDRYEGESINLARSGYGKLYRSDGTIVEAIWKDDEIMSKAMFYKKNEYYEGEIIDGEYNGIGFYKKDNINS